jgi:hypothetical protein
MKKSVDKCTGDRIYYYLAGFCLLMEIVKEKKITVCIKNRIKPKI